MRSSSITTDRLVLVPASPNLIREALRGDAALARTLGAALPIDWPPEFYDADTLTYALDRLESGPEYEGWSTYFFLRRDGRVIIGNGGYYAPPSEDGTVEVGYSVVPSMQGRGYATEATRGLIDRAFMDPRVERIVATTLPDRVPSIRVVEKLGFKRSDSSPEPGVIRFVLAR